MKMTSILDEKKLQCFMATKLSAIGATLSKREFECINLWLSGKTMKVIGELLFISPRTVETHINHAKEKLNFRTKHELVLSIAVQ